MDDSDPIDEFLDEMEGGRSESNPIARRSESNAIFALENRQEINLDWRDLTVEVGPNKLQILKSVSGTLNAGEMVAIMGPSGSGKTSLLNMLNGRYSKASWTGELRANGRVFDPHQWGDRAAFVQQGNYLLAHQTVKEVLTFAAKMRLFGTEEDIEGVVNKTLLELGLMDCANTFCGDETLKGISGGQAKRVCIGRDLVTNPHLIMLDEPTSGLDSFTAVKVVELLKRLSSDGRSVMMTIHQPSQTLTQLIDRFVVMDAGEVFIQGTIDEMKQKCLEKGFPCPDDTPITEWVFKMIDELPEDDLRTWKDEAKSEAIMEPMPVQGADLGDYKKLQTPCSFLYEIHLHLSREWILQKRNYLILVLEFGLAIGLFIVAFFCYYFRAKSDNDSEEFPVSAYEFAIYLGYAMVPIAKNAFSSTKFVYMVEYSCGTYTMSSYYFSKLFIIMIKIALLLLVIVPMVFFGMNFDGNVFVVYFYAFMCMINLALLASFFVILIDSALGSTVINLLIITVFDMLCMTKPNQLLSENFIASFKYFAWSRLFFCLVVNETSPPEVVEKHVQDAVNRLPLILIAIGHILLWGSLVPYMLRKKGKLMY